MPKFTGVVKGFGYLTVEAEDMYKADAIAQDMSTQEIMDNVRWAEIEAFPDEFPEES